MSIARLSLIALLLLLASGLVPQTIQLVDEPRVLHPEMLTKPEPDPDQAERDHFVIDILLRQIFNHRHRALHYDLSMRGEFSFVHRIQTHRFSIGSGLNRRCQSSTATDCVGVTPRFQRFDPPSPWM